MTECLDTIAAVQGLADLFVGLHETLELDVQLPVLASQHVAVVLQGFNLGAAVVVAAVKGLVCESQVVLLTASGVQGLVGDAALRLQVVEVGSQLTVTGELGLRAANQVSFFCILQVTSSVLSTVLILAEAVFVAGVQKCAMSLLKGLGGSAEVKLTGVSDLGELCSPFLGLVEIVVGGLDPVV